MIEDSHYAGLLTGIDALTHPDWHKLNVKCERNDRLMHAVLCAYAKHVLDSRDIGWSQLDDILHNVICNEIGDDTYITWRARLESDD